MQSGREREEREINTSGSQHDSAASKKCVLAEERSLTLESNANLINTFDHGTLKLLSEREMNEINDI